MGLAFLANWGRKRGVRCKYCFDSRSRSVPDQKIRRERLKCGILLSMYEQVTPAIYCIPVRLPNNPLRSLNCYVVKGPERNLLIDTGFNLPESFSDISEGIAGLSLDMDKTDIFLTHCHSDHTGLAGRIAAKGTRIYMNETDLPLTKRYIGEKQAAMESLYKRLLRAGYPAEEAGRSIALNPALANTSPELFEIVPVSEGFSFEIGELEIKAIHTPGHTPGHMCLYIEKEKILFTGDCVLFDITPNIIDWPEMKDSLGAYLESLRRLSSIDAALALPAHRKPGDLKKRIGELILHHERRLGEVLGILGGHGEQSTYEIASKMKWRIRYTNWDDFPVSQKSFAVGEARSHLRWLERRNKIIKSADPEVERFSIAK